MQRPGEYERATRARAFILFFGTRSIVRNEPTPPLVTRCPKCEQDVKMIAKSHRQWFTLFFLPIFPISGRMTFSQCSNCGTQFRVPPERLKTRMEEVESGQRQRAIAMYNSLRASPANAVTLNELMMLYAVLNDLDAAISAARDFPAALEASEQCMTTLGRIYLSQDLHGKALQWFDRAIERNPMYAEANYFKAVALMGQSPPDLERAQSAARAAKIGQHPNADLLLHDIEQKLRAKSEV